MINKSVLLRSACLSILMLVGSRVCQGQVYTSATVSASVVTPGTITQEAAIQINKVYAGEHQSLSERIPHIKETAVQASPITISGAAHFAYAILLSPMIVTTGGRSMVVSPAVSSKSGQNVLPGSGSDVLVLDANVALRATEDKKEGAGSPELPIILLFE